MSFIQLVQSFSGVETAIFGLITAVCVAMLPSRGLKREQDLADLKIKEIDVIQKTLDAATKFKSEFELKTDVAPLKREFDLLIAAKIDQNLVSFQALSSYFKRHKWARWIPFTPVPPHVSRPVSIAVEIKIVRQASIGIWLLFIFSLLLALLPWIKLKYVPWRIFLLIGEFFCLGIVGNVRHRWLAFKALRELEVVQLL